MGEGENLINITLIWAKRLFPCKISFACPNFQVIRNEGVFALWKGFTPYYMRLGPHTVITFIFLEQMNAAYYKYVLGIEAKAGL